MNKEEFNELFGKTTFIEHLNEKQQTELFETVKNLIDKEKVKEVIDKLIEKHKDDCLHCEGFDESESSKALEELKKELGVGDK